MENYDYPQYYPYDQDPQYSPYQTDYDELKPPKQISPEEKKSDLIFILGFIILLMLVLVALGMSVFSFFIERTVSTNSVNATGFGAPQYIFNQTTITEASANVENIAGHMIYLTSTAPTITIELFEDKIFAQGMTFMIDATAVPSTTNITISSTYYQNKASTGSTCSDFNLTLTGQQIYIGWLIPSVMWCSSSGPVINGNISAINKS